MILRNRCVEIVAPFVIIQIKLSPGWGQEYTPMIPMGLIQHGQSVLGGQVLNGLSTYWIAPSAKCYTCDWVDALCNDHGGHS